MGLKENQDSENKREKSGKVVGLVVILKIDNLRPDRIQGVSRVCTLCKKQQSNIGYMGFPPESFSFQANEQGVNSLLLLLFRTRSVLFRS